MSSTQTILVFLAVAVIVVAVAAVVFMRRRRALQEKFGEEYGRLVEEYQSPAAAEREMRNRERRHAGLELRELTPEARARYIEQWQEVQARFVDAPEDSVGDADRVVTQVLDEIGYPTVNYDEQVAHLSVDHARTLSAYRRAHDVTERSTRHEATVDELRQAVMDYRELMTELLGETPVPPAEPSETPTPRDSTRH
jgi:hypothetical protein